MPWDKLLRQPRRTFLKTAVAAGVLSSTSRTTAQAQINAEIADIEVYADRVTYDDTVPADVTIRNTGATEADFYVDYNVVAPGEDDPFPRRVDGEDGAEATLVPGDEATVTVEWGVDDEASTGSYDIYIAVYDQSPQADITVPLDEATLRNAFELRESGSEIDATINEFATDGGDVIIGENVESTVTVENTGDVEHTFYVGYSMYAHADGEAYSESVTGTSVTLGPGEQETVTVSWTAPEDAPTGPYDAATAVWEESSFDDLETQLDRAVNEAAISVEGTEREPTASFHIVTEDPIVGQEVEFAASGSEASNGTIEAYGWDFTGDGDVDATGETVTHTFDEPGEYEVTLTIVDDSGNEASTQQTVTVEEEPVTQPTADFDVITEDPIVGQEVEFNASDSEAPDGTIEEYRWDFTSDGETDETGEVVEYTFDESGEFEVTLTILDSEGNEATDQQIISVSYAEPPEIHAETIEIDPIAVKAQSESGLLDRITGGDEPQRPTLSAMIENAEEAWVNVIVDGEHRDSVEMKNRDGNLWETEDEGLPINESPGTRVDLEIETSNNAMDENEAVLRSTFGEEYLQEEDTLGYYIFDEVLEGVLVLGRFSDDEVHDDIARWAQKREIDINTYYGSSRGSMGAVGFNLRIELDNGEAYELDRTRGHYDGLREGFPFIGSRRSRAFMKDLKQKAELELDDEEFWIGTHPGTPLADQTAYYMSSWTLTGLLLDAFLDDFSNPIIYTPMDEVQRYHNGTPVLTDPALGVWYHELAHAYGFEHLYDRGDVGNYCLMHSGDTENPPEPICSPLRVGLFQEDHADERQDPSWLCERSWNLNSSDLDEPITISYRLSDFVRCGGSDSATANSQVDTVLIDDVRYIIEARREDPDLGGRSVVVYRQEIDKERDPANRLMQKGFLNEDYRTDIDTVGEDNPAVVKFELAESWTEGTTEELEVEVQLIPGGSTKAVLKDRTSLPDDWKFFSQLRDVTTPNLHLMAEDTAGNVIGKRGSEFVNEISGSSASGVYIGGTEWISVPTDTDVEFRVDSSDVQQFVDDIEARTDEDAIGDDPDLAAEFEISVTTYGDKPEIVRENGRVRVADTTTKTIRERIEPGTQQHVEPTNDGPCDIVSIHPSDDIAQEHVVFENTGDTILDLSGWTVKSPNGRTYVFPDGFTLEPGATVTLYTGSGTDTESNLYWGEDEPVWEEGGEVILQDSEEETILNIWYDERQVIYYDEPPEPEEDDNPFDVDLPEWAPFAGVAGVGLSAAGYLYGRYLRRKDSDDETVE